MKLQYYVVVDVVTHILKLKGVAEMTYIDSFYLALFVIPPLLFQNMCCDIHH